MQSAEKKENANENIIFKLKRNMHPRLQANFEAYRELDSETLVQKWSEHPDKDEEYLCHLMLDIVEGDPDVSKTKVEQPLCRLSHALFCIAIILREIDTCMSNDKECKVAMEIDQNSFQELQKNLIDKLLPYSLPTGMPLLDQLFHFPCGDTNIWSVAIDTKDEFFINCEVVKEFIFNRWKGFEWAEQIRKHPDTKTYHRALPKIRLAFENLGFESPLTRALLTLIAFIIQKLTLSTRALLQLSPIWRWCVHCAMEFTVLVIYQLVLFADWGDATTALLVTLWMLNLGNVWSTLLLLWHEISFNSRFVLKSWVRYSYISAILNLFFMVLVLIKLADRASSFQSYISLFSNLGGDWLQVAFSSMAFMVWAQALATCLLPASEVVAGQIFIFGYMLMDIVAFMALILTVLFSFTTFFSSLVESDYDAVVGYTDFSTALLTLVGSPLGSTSFTTFLTGLPSGVGIFATAVFVIYMTIMLVILMNFLIAIMSSRYDKGQFNTVDKFYARARVQDLYVRQVQYNIWCSPFCLIFNNVLFMALEAGLKPYLASRKKVLGRKATVDWAGWKLPDLDEKFQKVGGLNPKTKAKHDDPEIQMKLEALRQMQSYKPLPCLVQELPYTCMLLLVYPPALVIIILLYAIYAPFALLHFTFRGFYNVQGSWLSNLSSMRTNKVAVADKTYINMERSQAAKSLRQSLKKQNFLQTDNIFLKLLIRILLSPFVFLFGLLIFIVLALASICWVIYVGLVKIGWSLVVSSPACLFMLADQSDTNVDEVMPLLRDKDGDELYMQVSDLPARIKRVLTLPVWDENQEDLQKQLLILQDEIKTVASEVKEAKAFMESCCRDIMQALNLPIPTATQLPATASLRSEASINPNDTRLRGGRLPPLEHPALARSVASEE